MTPKPFRIFRVGTHTDSAGTQTTFTREQLEATVSAYNEGEWRAPLVAGHPKGNAPAYGWVGKMQLDADGNVVVDAVEKLNPDFAELMNAGAFRNRSASWYAPDHPANPTPGVWQLRHLGMLGAQPPALKGLGDVEFGEGEGITLEFEDFTTSTIGSLFRQLREALIGRWGVEGADQALPAYYVESIENAGREAVATTTASPDYSEPEAANMTPEQIAELQAKAAKADTLTADNAALQAQVASFNETQAAAKRAVAVLDAKASLQPLVDSGRLLPNQVDAAADFMVGLDNETATYEFGEATGDAKLTARAFFTSLLNSAPKQVEYGEVTANVSLPGNMKPAEIAQLAREYQDAMAGKGVTVTTTAAVDAVIAGKSA